MLFNAIEYYISLMRYVWYELRDLLDVFSIF